mgnify:CR=1 FL=1
MGQCLYHLKRRDELLNLIELNLIRIDSMLFFESKNVDGFVPHNSVQPKMQYVPFHYFANKYNVKVLPKLAEFLQPRIQIHRIIF